MRMWYVYRACFCLTPVIFRPPYKILICHKYPQFAWFFLHTVLILLWSIKEKNAFSKLTQVTGYQSLVDRWKDNSVISSQISKLAKKINVFFFWKKTLTYNRAICLILVLFAALCCSMSFDSNKTIFLSFFFFA